MNVIDRWTEARRAYAARLVRDAEATLRSVEATCVHNSSPEWVEELLRCRKNLEAARKALAEFHKALQP